MAPDLPDNDREAAPPAPVAYSLDGQSQEGRFLLLAISKGIRGNRVEESELPLPEDAFDWEELVRLAFENRVASLLSFALGPASKSGRMPSASADVLKKFFVETAQRNLRIKHSLNRILSALRERSIEVVALKGAALAYTLWPSMATRQMHDIDIVVPFERVREAIDALLALGYKRPGGRSVDWHLTHTKELSPFVDSVNGIEVELHYRFFTPNPMLKIDERPFWERSREVDFGGARARVLGPEELLVYLCLHVSVGHFLGDNLRSLLDIALVVERHRDSLNAETLRAYLNDPYVGPLVAFPVAVCARYLNVSFAPAINDAANALALHYRGIKLRTLERAAQRFLLKIKPEGASEWALTRLSKKIIYEPDAGLVRMLLCFIVAQEGITQFRDRRSPWKKMLITLNRRAKLAARLVTSPFGKKARSRSI